MIAWKRSPELQDLNIQAAMATNDYYALNKRAYGAFLDWDAANRKLERDKAEIDCLWEVYQNAKDECDQSLKRAKEATQKAIEGVLPTFTEEERIIYDGLVNYGGYRFWREVPRVEAWKAPIDTEFLPWDALQEVEFYIAIPKDDELDFEDAADEYDHGFEPFRLACHTDSHTIYRIDTIKDRNRYGKSRIGLADAVRYSGRSLTDIARSAGISRTQLSRMVNDQVNLDETKTSTMLALSKTLEVPVEDLMVRL